MRTNKPKTPDEMQKHDTSYTTAIIAAIISICFAANLSAQDTLVSYRLNLVKDPITKLYGYAFKKQNIRSPLNGMASTAVNLLGKSGSVLIGKEDADNIDWAIPPQYSAAATKFKENVAMVKVDNKIGFIDMYNRFVIDPEFDDMDDLEGFNQGIVAVKQSGKWGFIDKEGQIVIPFEYEDADNFNEKMIAAVKKDGKWGAIDIMGQVVVPFSYKIKKAMTTLPVSNKEWLSAAASAKESKDNGKFSARITALNNAATRVNEMIDDNEKQELKYTIVNSGDSVGVKDQYGRMIVPQLYKTVKNSNDVFIVERNGKFGAYLYNGARLIKPCFDSMSEFADGRSEVTIHGTNGWIDTDGNIDPDMLVSAARTGIETEKTNKQQARKIYETILDIDPEYVSAYNNLALLDIENHDYNKGMRKLKLAHELSPSDTVVSKNLKWAKESRKERRNERWSAGFSIAGAIIGAATTTYATYSSIKGTSSTGASNLSGAGSAAGGISSGKSAGGSGHSNVCPRCGGSGKCSSSSGVADKHYCHGSGKCGYCSGGVTTNYGQDAICTACKGRNICKYCHGSGKCPTCHGTGKR